MALAADGSATHALAGRAGQAEGWRGCQIGIGQIGLQHGLTHLDGGGGQVVVALQHLFDQRIQFGIAKLLPPVPAAAGLVAAARWFAIAPATQAPVLDKA
jgi:hypothetical protein